MSSYNINPVYFLSPLVPVIIGFALILFWRARRSFRWMVLLLGLIAYAAAIIIKVAFQSLTVHAFTARFGDVSVATGLYYGLQTSFLEVGIAYLVARYALSRAGMKEYDAESYGLSLSFWENVGLLGILPLISLVADYATIAAGGGLGSLVRKEILASNPALFGGSYEALRSVGLSVMERTSSLLAHFSWGFLVVASAARKKTAYFLIALPMGMIDALVPFAHSMNIVVFEVLLLAITLGFLAIALAVMKREGVPCRPVDKRTAENQ